MSRAENIQELLYRAAAEFLSREASRQSLVTVTRAELSEDRKRAVVYMSVYPESAEAGALDFANRHRKELGEYFESRVRGARIPHIEFKIDGGEKSRRRLDELTN